MATPLNQDGNQPQPSLPKGLRIYAIGDIHGCVLLLRRLLKRLVDDNETRAPCETLFVFLGDYIDRGPDSKGVVDELVTFGARFPSIFLKGNHEAMCLRFLKDGGEFGRWASNGGSEALASYGVTADVNKLTATEMIRSDFLSRLPTTHLEFFQNLRLSALFGDYFFVHGGVRPGVPLDQQREDDMLWIRGAFLDYGGGYGKIVVHGHTPEDEPVVKPNRIGIDTGAVFGGRLTALALEGTERRFLSVA
jgi:serine/threonine protein phosphatase 1